MVLLFFMDGVKYDMMKKHMPFLASLNSKPLMSEFGYSCACHATMYTSRYIEEHKTWFIWKKGNNSPYKWLNYIPGLKYIDFLPLKLILGKITNKLSGNTSYSGVPCLVNLPLKYWPMFEPCDTKMWNDSEWKTDIPNMFSILKNSGLDHQIIALHRGTKCDDAFVEEKTVDYAKDEFVFFFIGYTDNIMHSYGEYASESRKYLETVDEFIKSTYEKAKKEHDDVTVIAFSDHGHIELEEPKIDIDDYFKTYGTRVKNYIHLIEANFARFWFRNDSEREKITEVLNSMECKGLGFILTQEYLDRYHLNLDSDEHGDMTFYLAAPHEFTKTIWGFGKSVRSGHGYEPTLPKHYGIFCSNKQINAKVEFAYLTDVLPTVMAELNIASDGVLLRGDNIIEKY